MKWDVTIEEAYKLRDEGKFIFNPELSYELSAYRPITETQGLDFDPTPFIEVGRNQMKTGKYTNFPWGSKVHMDWWKNQHKLCNEGMTHNGYRITGDHYFFLNFYVMLNSSETEFAGAGRKNQHPNFWAVHYE